jgi:hypothetical protein
MSNRKVVWPPLLYGLLISLDITSPNPAKPHVDSSPAKSKDVYLVK